MESLTEKTIKHFNDYFHTAPDEVILSPGRINIIGEHVDYNDGFVLPAAIDRFICLAIAKTTDYMCTIIAEDIGEQHSFDINAPLAPAKKNWVNYLLGVLHELRDRGHSLGGFRLVFCSSIPMGAGLSSSAALECGFAFSLSSLFSLGLSRVEIALIGQKAEHTFVGVNCGIMDQFSSILGRKDHIIKLDCTTLAYEYYPFLSETYTFLLLDSGVKHTHLTSGYNVRRKEVETGLEILKKLFSDINTFRDCALEHIAAARNEMGEIIFRRCNYIVKEIDRVNKATKALTDADFTALGALMYATHEGLATEYEISCEEIDFLVDSTKAEPSVLGARMMGGGFGGCSINLIEKKKEAAFINKMSIAYKNKFNIDLKAYKINIGAGTHHYNTEYGTIQ